MSHLLNSKKLLLHNKFICVALLPPKNLFGNPTKFQWVLRKTKKKKKKKRRSFNNLVYPQNIDIKLYNNISLFSQEHPPCFLNKIRILFTQKSMFKRKNFIAKYAIILCLIMYIYIYILPIQKQQLNLPSTIEELIVEETNVYSGNCLGANVERNVDNNHRDNNRAYWNQLTDISIDRYKFGWKDFIRKEREKPQPTSWKEKRGIVFVAGNDDTLKRTVGTIRLLRKYMCVLPIEIWHMEHEAQVAATFTTQLESLGNVRLRDLSEFGLPKSISRMRNRGKQ